jgi:hypothetical protein
MRKENERNVSRIEIGKFGGKIRTEMKRVKIKSE